jgi:hypothetical protein
MTSTPEAVEVAQFVIDSVIDIRPSLKDKVVAAVEGDHLSVTILFTDGSYVRLTGLYANRISAHLAPTVL